MHGPHPLNLELLRDLLKAAVKVLTRSDQVLTQTHTHTDKEKESARGSRKRGEESS